VTPYYNKPTQAGLIATTRAVADAVRMPQILYNVPGTHRLRPAAGDHGALAEVPNIVGLKDATGDLAGSSGCASCAVPDFALYSGDDATGCEFMLRGGDGVISVTSNVAPALMRRMCDAALGGARGRRSAERPARRSAPCAVRRVQPDPGQMGPRRDGAGAAGIRLPLTWLRHPPRRPAGRDVARRCPLTAPSRRALSPPWAGSRKPADLQS
jgi:4-hydroxy-tetrahydrodipicolinate synthase